MIETMKKWIKRILAALLIIILAAGIGIGIYVSDYYHADTYAQEILETKSKEGTLVVEKNRIICAPENPIAGIIFYPGGKVQYEAYVPLMDALAQRGIFSVLLHMPGNLAVLDKNAADGIQEQYPEVKRWYIGGHSLGGAMAASYVSEHETEYEGLLLLAAYSTEDLSDTKLKVCSIYGTEDGVLNKESYQNNLMNLPENRTESIIEGGCHAYFGCYGAQKGDGNPAITNEEQIEKTADIFLQSIGA